MPLGIPYPDGTFRPVPAKPSKPAKRPRPPRGARRTSSRATPPTTPTPAAPVAPVNPQAALATNPAYLAYIRQLGAEEGEIESATTSRVQALERELNRRKPLITQQGERSRESISGGMESRGLFRSGQHEVDIARQRSDEGQEIGSLETSVRDQISDLTLELARKRAELARRRSEAGLQYAGDTYLNLAGF